MKELKELLKIPFGVCSFDTVREHLINCRKKAEIPENARSILLFVFPYKVRNEKPENISRYAAVADYHPIIEGKLRELVALLSQKFPDNIFVPFTDNSPVPEVSCAAAAGLGVVGDNGLLITEEYGSFVFIGEIVTDLYIPAQNEIKECRKCGLCNKACPVGLDKNECISKITQQKKPLTTEEEKLIIKGGSAWGCDICAEICPMNKNKALSNIEEFTKSYRNSFTPGEDTANRPYLWRGKEIILRNHNILCTVGVDAHIDPQHQRKRNRLENYNYNENGVYFITICTKNREKILSDIVGTGVLDCPTKTELLYYGKIADKYIKQLNDFYNDISVDKYVIMPDHIHLLLRIDNGQSGTPVPTDCDKRLDCKNSVIAKFVSTFKRFCNKEYGCNIWQPRYYDHIIRNEQDYAETWEYIENNAVKWLFKKD